MRLQCFILIFTFIFVSWSGFIPVYKGFDNRLWGVNIHYTKGRPGETLQLSKAYKIARMDFTWQAIEKTRNTYDFSQYNGLWTELHQQPNPVQCYWILDYGNPLYDGGKPPQSEEAIKAFVNFAVASLKNFKGKGIVWEMWNEPNGGFWPPQPNATAYSILANAVGSAIRSDPDIKDEIYVGPATSTIDLKYLEETFKYGVLNYFDAVSVHPYRGGGPETVLIEYNNLKTLIQKYQNKKDIPILSGEWGWSTCLPPCTPGWPAIISNDLQAKYLARQWLVNTLAEVPISIYYDYEDDGPDPTAREDNFGTVEHDYYNQTVPHVPKPAYQAALSLQVILSSVKFLKQIPLMDPETYVLAFSPPTSNNDIAYAIWKTSGQPYGSCDIVKQRVDCGFSGITKDQCLARNCCFQEPPPVSGPQCFFHETNTTANVEFQPITPGCFTVQNIYGTTISYNACTDGTGKLVVVGSDSPIYLKRK